MAGNGRSWQRDSPWCRQLTLIREPDFWRADLVAELVQRDVVSSCTHCNACVVATLAEGEEMRCPLRDGEEHFLKAASASELERPLADIEDLFTATVRRAQSRSSAL